MRRILVYLFCISITLQSIVGQFIFYDHSTDSFFTSIPNFSSNKKQANTHSSYAADAIREGHSHSRDFSQTTAELPKFVRDSAVEHLFSPSNYPNETIHVFVFSFLFLGNCFDLFDIEEKISNFVNFYFTFFRTIQIGLPITKIIFPYHNFY